MMHGKITIANGVSDDDGGGDDSDIDGNNVGESEEDIGEKQKGSLTGWRRGVVVTALVVSTKLLYVNG